MGKCRGLHSAGHSSRRYSLILGSASALIVARKLDPRQGHHGMGERRIRDRIASEFPGPGGAKESSHGRSAASPWNGAISISKPRSPERAPDCSHG
jgi:hypothetical protein